jgi:glycosyltransferase involved in cell wall biosynthesis
MGCFSAFLEMRRYCACAWERRSGTGGNVKISIVTISFNQAQYLRECIESVLNQDYPDIEYIVVDPGSTDGSREIIESYGDRIIRIFESDNGPADGLNKGFAKATGDIFYFINSDDFLLPNSIAGIAAHFRNSPESDVVLAGGLRVDAMGKVEGSLYPSSISARSLVNGAVTLFQQGMFFRSRLFWDVKGFNAENRTCWDAELLLAFLLGGAKPVRLMTKVAAFRLHPQSITGSQRFAAQFEADQERLFQLVYGPGRKPNPQTKMYYRAKKLLGDPLYVYKRILG